MKIVLIAAVLLINGSAVAGPYVNGGFESGSNPPSSYRSLYTGATDLTGWSVTGRVDWSSRFGNPGWSHAGDFSAQLVVEEGHATRLAQTFDTLPGRQYKISFYVAPAPNRPDPTIFIDFLNASGNQTYSLSLTADPLVYAYSRHEYVFSTAAGTSTSTLAFRNEGVYVGPFLDDITVEAVPEPASFAALGLGATALLRRRRAV